MCRGGGHDVAHSSDPPNPQGSSTSTFVPWRQVVYTFQKNGIIDTPNNIAPMVEIWFIQVKSSSGR